MYVIPDYKVCYLATPRTGSKAVAKALVEQRGAILLGSHHTVPTEHPEFEIDSTWTVLSTVRNHWDAMISWWFKIERRGSMTPLDDFLPRFCRNNTNFVRDRRLYWKEQPFTTHILRYEWLSADLDMALVGAGMAPVRLETIVDSKRESRPYQIFYKRATSEWVGDYFSAEIDEFGYKF